jgi:3-oxoacyl-[acyl-carrier protein] reductase
MLDFTGQVAIVTGSARGLGFGIAKKFCDYGARVAVVDLDTTRGEWAAQELARLSMEVFFAPCNISEEPDVESMLQQVVGRWGKVDILVNNAAIVGVTGNVWELPIDVMDKVYRVNLRGMFLCCQKVIPYMLKQDYGRIVNVASVAGKEGNPKQAPYSASKAAVIGFTKSLGKELAATKVTANVLSPGLVDTDILKQMTQDDVNYMLSKIPMGRTGTVEEMADMAAWIASRECSFSTAAVFDASGGRATY